MNIDSFFIKEQVIKLKSKEKQHVFKELIDKLHELKLIENKERFYAQIIHRESLENTGIGHGLAIPHARTESVKEYISIFGVLDEAIDYQSFDGKPVKYILLSIFPSELSTKYLYLIGMMARIFSNKDKRKIFDEEDKPGKIYTLLKNEAKIYFNSLSDKQIISNDSPESFSGVPSSDLDLLIRLDRLFHLYDENEKSDSVMKKIDDLKKLIDSRSLKYYERMMSKHSNPFSILEKGSCSGCHLNIPPIELNKIKEGKEIAICTHCGRFLIVV